MASSRTQIYLTEQQRQRVDELADERAVSMATVVRDAVDAYLWEVREEVSGTVVETFGSAPTLEVADRAELHDRGAPVRRTAVDAPADDLEFLEAAARRREVPLAVLLSEAVTEKVAALRRSQKPRLGVGASGGRSPGARLLTGEPVADPPR